MARWVEFECATCGKVEEVYVRVEDDGDGGVEYIPVSMRQECMIEGVGSTECCGDEMERI